MRPSRSSRSPLVARHLRRRRQRASSPARRARGCARTALGVARDEARGVSRRDLLGPPGPGLRRPARAAARARPRPGRAWRESHGTHVHRRQLGRLPDARDAWRPASPTSPRRDRRRWARAHRRVHRARRCAARRPTTSRRRAKSPPVWRISRRSGARCRASRSSSRSAASRTTRTGACWHAAASRRAAAAGTSRHGAAYECRRRRRTRRRSVICRRIHPSQQNTFTGGSRRRCSTGVFDAAPARHDSTRARSPTPGHAVGSPHGAPAACRSTLRR